MPFLNQQKGENDRIKYFMINLHERMLPTSAGIEPPTSCSLTRTFTVSLHNHWILQNTLTDRECPSPKVTKLFSCSTQLSMKFSLLINMKMLTIVRIFVFISREIFMLSYYMFSKKELAIISNLRFISRTNFMLS